VAVSSVTQPILRRLPTEALRVDVVDELVIEFWKYKERSSHIEKSNMRVCDLILGLPSDLVGMADRLEEAVGWLWTD
jgi:hypothetical protein